MKGFHCFGFVHAAWRGSIVRLGVLHDRHEWDVQGIWTEPAPRFDLRYEYISRINR